MTPRIIKEIVKILSSKDLTFRPALQQIFTSGNKLYATDGYIAIEICELRTEEPKCLSLQELKMWLVTHPEKDALLSPDDLKPLEESMPDMEKVLYGKFEKTCSRVAFDIKKLKQSCDYLKTTNFEVLQNDHNANLFKIEPIGDSRTLLEKAIDSKVYLMGLK